MAGPGSLMYAVVLSYDLRPALRSLDEAHLSVERDRHTCGFCDDDELTCAELGQPPSPHAIREGPSEAEPSGVRMGVDILVPRYA